MSCGLLHLRFPVQTEVRWGQIEKQPCCSPSLAPNTSHCTNALLLERVKGIPSHYNYPLKQISYQFIESKSCRVGRDSPPPQGYVVQPPAMQQSCLRVSLGGLKPPTSWRTARHTDPLNRYLKDCFLLYIPACRLRSSEALLDAFPTKVVWLMGT